MQELLARLAEHAAAAPPLVTLLLVFLGGVLSSASPCVLAAVPLVIATVGGAATSRSRAVLLSVSFVLGLALCFTALGAAAALTGRLIGNVGPWWRWPSASSSSSWGSTSRAWCGCRCRRWTGRASAAPDRPARWPRRADRDALVALRDADPGRRAVARGVREESVVGDGVLAAYSLGHVVLLFVAGAASGFAAAYLELGRRLAQRLHQGLGALMVGVGAWVLVPIAIGAFAK